MSAADILTVETPDSKRKGSGDISATPEGIRWRFGGLRSLLGGGGGGGAKWSEITQLLVLDDNKLLISCRRIFPSKLGGADYQWETCTRFRARGPNSAVVAVRQAAEEHLAREDWTPESRSFVLRRAVLWWRGASEAKDSPERCQFPGCGYPTRSKIAAIEDDLVRFAASCDYGHESSVWVPSIDPWRTRLAVWSSGTDPRLSGGDEEDE